MKTFFENVESVDEIKPVFVHLSLSHDMNEKQ